jgi:cell division protein ZapE
VNNIVDAMIVGRLFKVLVEKGVFLVFTSNRAPQELFKDGLQRERFLPFIELIETRLFIYHLNSFQDYRLSKVPSLDKFYFHPLNEEAKLGLKQVIEMITGGKNLRAKNIFINKDRSLRVDRSYGRVAIFTFNELCQQPLGAMDYIAIAKNFDTLVIENVPKLNADNHNEALRFITLIDCLYEHSTRLILSAEVEVEKLYEGARNRFEFDRTISRLKEMQSIEYNQINKQL